MHTPIGWDIYPDVILLSIAYERIKREKKPQQNYQAEAKPTDVQEHITNLM